MIKELTRLINLSSVFAAVFTSGEYIPTPICTCRYVLAHAGNLFHMP